MTPDSIRSSEDSEAYLKRKLGAGVGIFYLVNLLAFFIGSWVLESFGNIEGLVVMLLVIYGLNVATGLFFMKVT